MSLWAVSRALRPRSFGAARCISGMKGSKLKIKKPRTAHEEEFFRSARALLDHHRTTPVEAKEGEAPSTRLGGPSPRKTSSHAEISERVANAPKAAMAPKPTTAATRKQREGDTTGLPILAVLVVIAIGVTFGLPSKQERDREREKEEEEVRPVASS
mmetsp:Transcript_41935/g.88804  ORF Transcript_41935/g.88804 Transcript_41935/m.88804 type:complete len:157 (-) Transcript_41935:107-577(-)